MKISCLGAKTSHSYAAAAEYIKRCENSGADVVFKPRISDCIVSLENDECDLAVVPFENSVEGAVNEALDSLYTHNVYITCELSLKISHSLYALKGASPGSVKRIYSHPQALAQCRGYLESNYPLAELMAANSTSDALEKIKSLSEAAIARSDESGRLSVLAKGIEDYASNETRFVFLRSKPVFVGDKCCVVFGVKDEPGALLAALGVFKEKRINMTRLFSRPEKGKNGRYSFFTDFDFSGSKDELNAFLAALSESTGYLKFLGQYKTL